MSLPTKKIICLISGLILIIVSNAYAMERQPGPYLGGQIGWGRIDEGDGYRQLMGANELGIFAGMGWRAYLGYSFNPIFSIESGYSGYPSNTYSSGSGNIKVKTYTVDLVGKITIPLEKLGKSFSHFSIYGKGGAAYLNTRTNVNTAMIVNKSSETIMPIYGAGIIFNFTDNIAVDASWTSVLGRNHIDNSNDVATKNPVPTCHMFTLGFSYKVTGIF